MYMEKYMEMLASLQTSHAVHCSAVDFEHNLLLIMASLAMSSKFEKLAVVENKDIENP